MVAVIQLLTALSAFASAIMWIRSAYVPECLVIDCGVVGEETHSELQEEFKLWLIIMKLFGGYDTNKIKTIQDAMFLTSFFNRSAASFAAVSAFLLFLDSFSRLICRQ